MISYCKSYYWLIWLRYLAAYTVSPSPWTYPSSERYSLAVVAVHLLKLCCSQCCSPEYLQHAFFVLICKSRRRISCNMPYSRMWLIRLAAFGAGEMAPISRSPCSVLDHSPDCKWNTHPHGLFALPAAEHAWERTCHFKHCSYVIFTSSILLLIYYMGIWFSTGIYRLTLVIKHWKKKTVLFKRCGKRDQKYF